jgi:hypothetical protein
MLRFGMFRGQGDTERPAGELNGAAGVVCREILQLHYNAETRLVPSTSFAGYAPGSNTLIRAITLPAHLQANDVSNLPYTYV